MRFRILLVLVLLTASAWAGIVDDVRIALMQNNFSGAEAALNSYRGRQGVTPEYLEAYSWMARAALDAASVRPGGSLCQADAEPGGGG